MSTRDLTTAELDERRDRAVAAARAVAEDHGVVVDEPRVPVWRSSGGNSGP